MALIFTDIKKTKEEITQELSKVKCWLLDMDGTVSLGENMIKGVDRFFDKIEGKQYVFITNNPSRSTQHYVNRMTRIGIPTTKENVITSTDALKLYLKKTFTNKIRAFMVGTPDFEKELMSDGIERVKEMNEDIDAVLVAFDTTLTYSKLDIACDYIRKGVPWYATNPDKVCPLENNRVLPDCGAIIAFLKECTGTNPEIIIGKPETTMIEMVLEKFGLERGEVAIVGDRLYTDIAVAINSGVMSVAVLSGESKLKDIEESNITPNYIFDTLGDVGEYID